MTQPQPNPMGRGKGCDPAPIQLQREKVWPDPHGGMMCSLAMYSLGLGYLARGRVAVLMATTPLLPIFLTHREPHGPDVIALSIWPGGQRLNTPDLESLSPVCVMQHKTAVTAYPAIMPASN